MAYKLVIVLFCVTVNIVSGQQLIVETASGPVRGLEEHTIYDNRPYVAFRGIPFAEPPVGHLRFRPPQKIQPWNEILNAYEYGNVCHQLSFGSEDCLFLNVYSPNVSPSARLPVIIGIHGGAFTLGSSNNIGPDFLFNEADVVMVTMNYRLGVFGFLSLNTTEYSGNMGLKDQFLAIKWVKENIGQFGGDPEQITLYGLSAGSTSVHLQALSPVSRSYFQRAILASGSALNPWSSGLQRAHESTMFEFANRNSNTPIETFDQLIGFLLNVDADTLAVGTIDDYVPTDRAGVDLLWAPVVEPLNSDDAFLTETPTWIMANDMPTHISTLWGYCSAESFLFVDQQLRNPELLEPLNERFGIQLPIYSMNDRFVINMEENSHIADEIRQFYFGHMNGQVDASTRYELTQLVSDTAFNYGIDISVSIHAAAATNAQAYYYRFSVEGLLNFVRLLTVAPSLGFPGATHGDDNFYAMGNIGSLRVLYELLPPFLMERRIIRDFSRMYTNFIVTGNPGFSAVNVFEKHFVDLTNNGFIAGIDPQRNTTYFWNNLFEKYQMW